MIEIFKMLGNLLLIESLENEHKSVNKKRIIPPLFSILSTNKIFSQHSCIIASKVSVLENKTGAKKGSKQQPLDHLGLCSKKLVSNILKQIAKKLKYNLISKVAFLPNVIF